MSSFLIHLSTLFVPIRMAVCLGRGWFGSSDRRAIITTAYRMLWSIARGARKPERVSLWFRGVSFVVVLESSADFALVREVFLDEEYRHPEIVRPDVVFDVGANVGIASLYFHCLYPHATIYAFEPDPILFEKLLSRVSGVSHITPLQIALSDKNGDTFFYRHESSPLAGSLLPRSTDAVSMPVKTSTLASITAQLGIHSIDLLKFDIEGGERILFASAQDRACARRLIGEVHLDLLGMSKEAFVALLPDFDMTYVRQTAECRYIMWAEKRTSSQVSFQEFP